MLAILASMYAVYHGPEGLRRIAGRVHRLTATLAAGLVRLGFKLGPTASPACFDTLRVELGPVTSAELVESAAKHRVNLRVLDERTVGVSLDETTTLKEVETLLRIFNLGRPLPFAVGELTSAARSLLPRPSKQ